MKKVLASICIGMFLGNALLWASSGHGAQTDQGKSLYEQKCQICHGANGKGDGPAAGAFNPGPADFTKPDFWHGKVQKITETLRKGKGGMPAFTLTDDEIKAITDYLTQTFKGQN